MRFNSIHSAILRGRWLLDKSWADAHMPLVFRMLKGEAVDFGINPQTLKEENSPANEPKLPVLEHRLAGRNLYSASPYTNISALPGESIVMVTLSGPLLKDGGMCSYGMIDHTQLANELANANNVSGVIYNIDSPGGQASGTAMFADAIKNLAAIKPVIAFINDGIAASAAMWLASAANERYVSQPTDQLGSIGVYTTIADWYAHYRDFFKLNIQDVYAPQSTQKNRDYRDATSADPATQQDGINAIEEDLSVLADQFINTVATNIPNLKGKDWQTGKMFYAPAAKSVGLINGIKSLGQVVDRMNSLISSRNKSQTQKNMAFEKTISAAKAESFGVVEGGFLLQEDQLTNIENTLTAAEQTAASLETANASIVTLTEGLSAEKVNVTTVTAEKEAAVQKAADQAAEHTTAIAAKDIKIAELEAEVVKLGKKPSGSGSALPAAEDEHAEEAGAAKPGLLDPNHPLNLAVGARLARTKKS